MNDNKVRMPGSKWQDPLGPSYIRYMEGPIDPEVGVMCFQTDSVEMLAMLATPHLSSSKHFSATNCLRGLARRHGRTQCAILSVVIVCPSSSTVVAATSIRGIRSIRITSPDHQRMGSLLAKTTQAVIEALPYEEDLSLDWKVRHVKLPIREVEPELLAQSRRILEENPEPRWSEQNPKQIDPEWIKAGSILSVHLRKERAPELDYEIQVLRVGKTAFVGLPGEPFVEGQLQLKMASPTYPTYIAHCTSHYVGYLPIPDAFPRGGHEVETRFWAKLEPEALEMVVDAAAEVLHEVFES